MTPERKHNLLVAPVVFLVRVPILLPFMVLAILGDWAERAGAWIGGYLPTLKQEWR